MTKNDGAMTSRREWRRRISRKPWRDVRLGKGAEAHRKRADEMVRYAEYRKANSEAIKDAWPWVRLYHHLRRAQYRAENLPTFAAQKRTAKNALAEAWRFNLEYCSPPLSRPEFDAATVVDGRWYFTSSRKFAHDLGITEAEALATGAQSLLPINLWAERQQEKWEAWCERRERRWARNALIADLIDEGWSNSQIAEKVGVHRTTAWRHRRKLNDMDNPYAR